MTMISQKLNDAINAQIGREFGASMQYLQIAAYFDSLALDQAAKLFFEQADEERDHAMKFLKYVLEAGGELHIPAPLMPPSPTSPRLKKLSRGAQVGNWMLPARSIT
jgi:bacterioferritin B